MFEYEISKHAMTRMSQRGVQDEDIELVLMCGTQIGPDEWLMKQKDANREIAKRERVIQRLKKEFSRVRAIDRRIVDIKREIQKIERLSRKQLKVVTIGGMILTCYSSSRADLRRTLFRRRAS